MNGVSRAGPLGLCTACPSAIKDIFDTADMPTENGSVLYAGRTPSRDADGDRNATRSRSCDHGEDGHNRVCVFFPW